MTPLTGMTALEAAEELRCHKPGQAPYECRIVLTGSEAEHLASLLDEGAQQHSAYERLVAYDAEVAARVEFVSGCKTFDELLKHLEQGARDTERLACAEAILQVAPQAPAGHFAGTDWLDCYREWWMCRIPGTAAILDSREAPRE